MRVGESQENFSHYLQWGSAFSQFKLRNTLPTGDRKFLNA